MANRNRTVLPSQQKSGRQTIKPGTFVSFGLALSVPHPNLAKSISVCPELCCCSSSVVGVSSIVESEGFEYF